MTLDDFRNCIFEAADSFEAMYLNGNESEPEDWPMSMDEVDWWEQFIVWLESKQ